MQYNTNGYQGAVQCMHTTEQLDTKTSSKVASLKKLFTENPYCY